MKRSRNVVAAVVFSFTLAGCAAEDDVAAPDGRTPEIPPQTPTSIVASSVVNQIGIANSLVTLPPVVTVLDQNGAPMSRVEVSFAIADGGGSVAPDRVLTNNLGIARTSWRLGNTAGENTLTATVSGIQPVVFKANSLLPGSAPEVRASRWDLLLVAGQRLPLTYSGGSSTWTITGGHYVFLDDSTYAWGYEVNGVDNTRPAGRYVVNASAAVQFYNSWGNLVSTATIQGNLATVTYEDIADFDPEIYVMADH